MKALKALDAPKDSRAFEDLAPFNSRSEGHMEKCVKVLDLRLLGDLAKLDFTALVCKSLGPVNRIPEARSQEQEPGARSQS